MDRTIVIEVNGSYIRKDSNVAGVTGEGNSRFMRLIFDESWLEYAKTVTFWDAKGENPVKRVLTTDYLTDPLVVLDYTVPIPAEALTCQGRMTFVIDGSIEGARKRSVSDNLKVEYAPQADDANDPVDPTPSQFEQIQAQVDKILPDIIEERLQAQEARNEAVNAAEEATASAESASAASESAGVAMVAAVEAANVAREAQAGAIEAKEAAQKIKEEITDVAGGDFPTREEAQGYANQAETNAKTYTDEKLADIPTPDVSGQIGEHNTSTDAHPAIRERINSLEEKVGDVVLSELDILDYEVVTAEEFKDMEKQEDVLYLVENDPETQAVKEHIVNTDIHVTSEEKAKWNTPQIKRDEIPNLHVWKFTDVTNGIVRYLASEHSEAYTEGDVDLVEAYFDLGENLGDTMLNSHTTASHYIYWDIADESGITVDVNGNITYTSSSFVQVTTNTKSSANGLKGKYIKFNSGTGTYKTGLDTTKVYYVPTDAVFTYVKSSASDDGTYQLRVDKIYEVVGYPESSSGTYTYMGQLGEGGAKFVHGSYKGTDNEVTLNFDFDVKMLFVKGLHTTSTNYAYYCLWIKGDNSNDNNDMCFGAQVRSSSVFISNFTIIPVGDKTLKLNTMLSSTTYIWSYVAMG